MLKLWSGDKMRKYRSILKEDPNVNITGNMVTPFQDWLNANVETHRKHYRTWKSKQEDDGDKIGPKAFTGPEMITKYFSENTDRYEEFMNWYGKNKNKFINKYKANLKFLPDRSKKDPNNQNYFFLNYFTGSNEEIKKTYDDWYNKNYNNTDRVPSNAEVIHNFLKQNPEFVDQYVNITQKVNSLSPVMKKWINNNLGNSEVKAFLAWLTNVDPSSITESIIFENNEAHKEDPVYKAFLASQGGTNSDNKPIEVTKLQRQKILRDILSDPEIKNAYNKFLAEPKTTTESRFFSKRKLNEQIFTPQFNKFARTLVKTSPALAQQLQQAAVRAVQNVFGPEADAATLVNQEFQGLEDPFGTPNQSTVDAATGNNTNFAATTNNKDGTPNDDIPDPSADPEDGPFGTLDQSTVDIATGNDTNFAATANDKDSTPNDTDTEPTTPDKPGVIGRVGNFVSGVASDAQDVAGNAANAVGNLAGDAANAVSNVLNRQPKPQATQGQAGTPDPENDVLPNEPGGQTQPEVPAAQSQAGADTPYGDEFDTKTSNAAAQTAQPAAQPAKPAAQPAAQPAKPAAQPAKPAAQPAAQTAKPAAQPKYYPGVTEPDYNKSLRIAQTTLKRSQGKLSQGNPSNLDKMQAQADVQRQNQLIKMYQNHLLAKPRTAKGKLIHHRNMLNRSAVAAGQAGDQAARQKFKQEAAKIDAQIRNMKESKLIDLQSYINKL